ncbi:MAG: AAA family ATPase, partial [Ignavibacteriae bacterium]|nr:AAA family ATPase [Ignavibacteriota bacterium]
MKKKKTNRTTQDKTTPSRTSSLEIPLAKLRWKCSPEDLGIGSMEEAEHVTEIIGQDRALRALRVGLEMQHHGYNIFVTGDSGTGRTTTIKRLLEEFETRRVDLTDKCYVHNFHDPDSPLMIALPAGQGASFRKDIAGLLTELVKGIPAVFESRRYQEQRKATLEHFQERQRSVLKDLERKVKEKGFEVVQVQQGPGMRPEIAPVIEGSPISIDQLQSKVDEGVMTHGEMQRLIVQQGELERLMDIAMR